MGYTFPPPRTCCGARRLSTGPRPCPASSCPWLPAKDWGISSMAFREPSCACLGGAHARLVLSSGFRECFNGDPRGTQVHTMELLRTVSHTGPRARCRACRFFSRVSPYKRWPWPPYTGFTEPIITLENSWAWDGGDAGYVRLCFKISSQVSAATWSEAVTLAKAWQQGRVVAPGRCVE